MKYVRDENCECAKYIDASSADFAKLANKTAWWRNGYIYENVGGEVSARPCSCYKTWLVDERYRLIAKDFSSLPDAQSLTTCLGYKGEKSKANYLKLLKTPEVYYKDHYENLVVFVKGTSFTQKTTSVAKLLYELLAGKHDVIYTTQAAAITKLNSDDAEAANRNYLEAEWLIVDDMFMYKDTPFYTVYDKFFNMLCARKNPTVLVGHVSPESASTIDSNCYKQENMERLLNKIKKYNSLLTFEDDIKVASLLTDGKVDIWS